MQSAVGATKTLSAISLASPGVFTGTHDFSVGDFVLLEVEGMRQVHNRIFQVLSVSTTVSFQLEAIDGSGALDTTLFTAFTSGTAKKITLGTAVSGVQDFAPSGGDAKMVSTTTVHDLADTEKVVGSTAKRYTLTLQWDPANAGQIAMLAAFEADAPKAFKITWPSGRFILFYASIGYTAMPGGTTQGTTTAKAELALLGAPTFGL